MKGKVCDMEERLRKQLDFALEIDKEKNVLAGERIYLFCARYMGAVFKELENGFNRIYLPQVRLRKRRNRKVGRKISELPRVRRKAETKAQRQVLH